MILTDAYFENIQATIRKELLMAKRTVYAAVAWFTDDVLFQTLLELQRRNVLIQLCVVEDDINFKDNGLPFKSLIGDLGKFFAISGDKMHHKFCVIDESVVITGSYNWTYKAANAGKDENIIVTSGDWEIAQKFIQEFLKITGQEFAGGNTDLNKVLKRCKVILQLLQLDEVEDVHKQAKRLINDAPALGTIQSISVHLLQNNFATAIEEINELLTKYQALQVYKDPLINALKLEIKLLEYQLIALENEKADVEKKVFEYDRLFNEILGETVKKYLDLKRNLKEQSLKEKPESETAQTEFEEADTDYNEFFENYEETKEQSKEYNELLTEEEAIELKKMYRLAATLCHPDKFVNEPDNQEIAETIFKELSNAYQKQDIEKVKSVLENLKQGIFNTHETNTKVNDVGILKKILGNLKNKYEKLIYTTEKIKLTEAFKVIIMEQDLKGYFYKLKESIEGEILILMEQLK